jgi:hypothetical protein
MIDHEVELQSLRQVVAREPTWTAGRKLSMEYFLCLGKTLACSLDVIRYWQLKEKE